MKQYQADYGKIASRYHISETMAEVLVKRGLYDWEAMDRYLYPCRSQMYPPEKLKDLEKAAGILSDKLGQGKKLLVIGDYDVDGIVSTYILVRGLQALGGDVDWRIPHRARDGYGIREYMVEEAFEGGVDTIITCDNGISAGEPVKLGKRLGMTVIITDHHEVPRRDGEEIAVPADAVVNPKQEACTYPFSQLCGAGVAYKLVEYLLRKEKGCGDLLEQLLVFAGIATICDVVPLQDENRIIAHFALEQIRNTGNVGLDSLLRELDYRRPLTARDIGFGIGPCLNAAGRLESASQGLQLFLEKDPDKAAVQAAELLALNRERKELTRQAVCEAAALAGAADRVLVIYLEDCHESIAGIVAGRIRELYYRPTLIVTRSGDLLKGSGRSIPGYHMQQELSRCRELLVEFGGHPMAAGFSLLPERLDALRTTLNENCQLTPEQLTESVVIDKELPLEEADPKLAEQLQYLSPVGEGNPAAVFARRGIRILSVRICGKENQIGRFRLQEGEGIYPAVDFDLDRHVRKALVRRYGEDGWEKMARGESEPLLADILYVPELNEKYGDLQLRILDCR